MICLNCNQKAHHKLSDEHGDHCENCTNMPVTSKNKTDGIITRNSWRVRRQQSRFEGDMVIPHIYDKNLHREKVNPDFVKLYGPEKTKEFFSSDELKRDGYSKMPAVIDKIEQKKAKHKERFVKDTIYSGSSKKAIANFLGEKL